MRRQRPDPWPAAPEFEHIARFGDAEIVKDLRGRFHLHGGGEADQAEARAWAARFISRPLYEPREVRYTLIQWPERPKRPQRQWPTPKPRPLPTADEQWEQYCANNPPSKRLPSSTHASGCCLPISLSNKMPTSP